MLLRNGKFIKPNYKCDCEFMACTGIFSPGIFTECWYCKMRTRGVKVDGQPLKVEQSAPPFGYLAQLLPPH